MKQVISTLSFLVLLFVALPASAQNPEISVASFRELETDLTANIAGTSKIDQNGQTAALIKVVTTERGFNFDAGVLGIVATEQKSGEIWVYVPDGVRFLTISHPQLGILRSYPLPMQVKSGKTYELVLITGKVRTIVENAPMEQWVVFHVAPSDALLEFDDQIIEVDETGSATCYKTYGTYSYRAEHADYHPEIGQISVGPEKTVVDINLRPRFGWLKIDGASNAANADVYIDGRNVGTLPLPPVKLLSGNHAVKITKPLYKIFQRSVTVTDSDTAQISVSLVSNFRQYTVSSDADADIYINNEAKGRGSWTGPLESGTYLFEARKTGHRPSRMSRTINADDLTAASDIVIPSPTPIFGAVNITSSPIDATVELDGKIVGQTPVFVKDVIIGSHSVKWSKPGYRTEIRSVTVKEGRTAEISLQLDNEQNVSFTSNVPAQIYIDGEYRGTTPCTLQVTCTEHIIEARADHYRTVTKPYVIGETTDHIYMPLEALFKSVHIRSNTSAAIYIDGVLTQSSTRECSIDIPFGRHTIKASTWKGTKEKEIEVTPYYNETVDFTFRENRIKDNAFYLGATYQALNTKGWGAIMGCFAGKFNLETSITFGKSEEFQTTDTFGDIVTTEMSIYRINAKAGWGIRLGNHFRLTPQVGAAIILADDDDYSTELATAVGFVGSMQLSWVISSWLNITVTPEYYLPIHKSEMYESYSAYSDSFQNAIDGFDLQLGVSLIF